MKLVHSLLITIVLYALSSSGNTYSQWSADTLGMIDKDVVSMSFSGNNIIAGTRNSGIFYRETYSKTWKRTNLQSQTVSSIVVSGNIVIAGAGENGIYYSIDSGKYWNESEIKSKTVLTILIHGSLMYAGTASGIYKSTNNGLNWKITPFVKPTYSIAIKDSVLYAGAGNDVYMITNGGLNWSQTNLGKLAFSLLTIDNKLLAGTDGNGVFELKENTLIWDQTLKNNITVYSITNIGNLVFAGTYENGVKYSYNSGTSWFKKCFRSNNYMWNSTATKVYIFGSVLYACTGHGIYTTDLMFCIEPGK